MKMTKTWISTLVLALLAVSVRCATIEYPNQLVLESPDGLSLEFPENKGTTATILSYLISGQGAVIMNQSDIAKPYIEAKVFLGNNLFAGDPEVWTNSDLHGDWTKLKKAVQIDPCRGVQDVDGPAYLLLDGHNVTLKANVTVATRPLQVLSPDVPARSDASNCFHTSMEGAPVQCHEFFHFDFSSASSSAPAGFSWGLTIESTNGNPLPFTSAILAAGPACPSKPSEDEDSWMQIPLQPDSPGNSPTKYTLTSLAIGTHFQKWWIQLKSADSPHAVPGETPFSITAHYNVVGAPANVPTQASPPVSEPVQEQPQSQPAKPRKHVPVWALALICIVCALIAAAALFFAWKQTREKQSSNSYEIY